MSSSALAVTVTKTDPGLAETGPAQPGRSAAELATTGITLAGLTTNGLTLGPAVVEPEVIRDPTSEEEHSTDVPWVVLVWNDPINLMSYVVYVFQKLFGYNEAKATELMLDVHHKGRAAVAWGTREKAELDVFRLHEYGLWATMQQDH